ncbi:MAG: adenosylmethionine--8-amino-7-oxononanoate transaminase, partial [Candidatus Bathyarchaeia archaeon]
MVERKNTDELKRDDTRYIWHHYAQMADYAKEPLVIEKAEGIFFQDIDGKKYMDAVSGVFVVNIGHGN